MPGYNKQNVKIVSTGRVISDPSPTTGASYAVGLVVTFKDGTKVRITGPGEARWDGVNFLHDWGGELV